MSDTRDELRRDQWIQDHKFECCTCQRKMDDPLCADCEGQNWKEKDWALERKQIIQKNMEMLSANI